MDGGKLKMQVPAIVNNDWQYWLRLVSVLIGTLLNAKWYRDKYPDGKLIFLLVIPSLLLGLFWPRI